MPSSGGGPACPELSGMAAHHPPEFFAESIINPNAVIDRGEGFTDPDAADHKH